MKKDLSMLYFAIIGSLFTGFIIISIGIGALIPSMHKLTAPLICRGEVDVDTTRYSIRPGETYWEHKIYCIKTGGGVDEITFPAIGMTGLVASAIIFAILAYRWRETLVVDKKDFGTLATDLNFTKKYGKQKKQRSPLDRLSELKKMRDQNLISEAEYDRKKTEIMEEL